jgi:integrase
MSIFRFRNSKVYWMDFFFHGQRIQESTGTRSKTLAKKIQDKRRRELEEGAAGIKKRQQPILFSVAGEEYLAARMSRKTKKKWSPKMLEMQKNAVSHLLPDFGKKLVMEIEAKHIAAYQEKRTEEGAAGRTVNIEVTTLRSILRRHQQWERVQDDVVMLEEREDVGRALTAEEESALLLECGRSRSRLLLPFVVLALETGARFNTVRTLQWRRVDFASRCLKWGKDKTPSGTGRIVPLNPRALEILKFWAQQFPDRKPDHYVFPFGKCGGSGKEDNFGFTAGATEYETDPSKPIGDIKESWESAKKRTRRHCPKCKIGILADKPKLDTGHVCLECQAETEELPAGLVDVRFHDLRHTAVSRMIAARIPLPIIARITGWSHSTIAEMAKRYGHFDLEELRKAVAAISTGPATIFDAGSLEFSLESPAVNKGERAN